MTTNSRTPRADLAAVPRNADPGDPGAAPGPEAAQPGRPAGLALGDPVTLARAAAIVRTALARQRLALAGLEPASDPAPVILTGQPQHDSEVTG